VGGGPGTGKTTLSLALASDIGAQVISTDDVRRELQQSGVITGRVGELDAGLYTPENVSRVYDEVLRRARQLLADGTSVILDGTWRDDQQRTRARELADKTASSMIEFTCSLSRREAAERILGREESTSDATPEIAAALAERESEFDGHRLDTSRPLAESVAEAMQICRLAI
jgi:predicted kinase